MMTRYWLVAACTIGMSALTGAALAQTAFPSRPVRVLTAGAPGGGSDLTTRAIANWLSLAWGQQVIVDNRPGAAGLTAFDNFVKANCCLAVYFTFHRHFYSGVYHREVG